MRNSILFSILLAFFTSCETSSEKCSLNFEKSFKSVLKSKGKPNREKQISIYKGMNLYEYQNSLYKYIPNRDTTYVTESVWECYEYKLIVWHIKDSIVDYLHMDESMKH